MRKKEITIVVMPLRNLSSEPDTEHFADGFVDDLTTDLTRFPSLRVLAAQSTFELRRVDQSTDEVASKWGLDFIPAGEQPALRPCKVVMPTRGLWHENLAQSPPPRLKIGQFHN